MDSKIGVVSIVFFTAVKFVISSLYHTKAKYADTRRVHSMTSLVIHVIFLMKYNNLRGFMVCTWKCFDMETYTNGALGHFYQ